MRTAVSPDAPRRERGFTLIELLIAIVVLGVLAAIALPSYQDSVRKSRRSEAFSAISALQQAQERRRANHPAYTTTLSDLGWSGTTTLTGLYTVSLAYVSEETKGSGYIVSAVGASGTSQADDRDCRKLSVRVLGGNIDYAGCGSCESFSYAASNRCWAR